MSDKKINFNKINKIYCIGIGGIGLSAGARILKFEGKEVSGSDASENEITISLPKEGINVTIGQNENEITKDIDLVVYSVAVLKNHPQRVRANELGIKQISYPCLLGELTKQKKAIAVSGTDGKTTTSILLALMFAKADLDPTVVLGGQSQYFKGNAKLGQGDYFIFEADEYKRAFDNYNPYMAVITHIKFDHSDCYKDLSEVKEAFYDYVSGVNQDGYVFFNVDDANSKELPNKTKAKAISFGILNPADIMAKNIEIKNGRQKFTFVYKENVLGEIILKVPGRYNIYNALSASCPALVAGISFETIKNVLEEYRGSWRRFEKIGRLGKAEVIADYAHTPDAVAQTVDATESFYPDKKILYVFQPHQYSRTKIFFDDFSSSFDRADDVIFTDIFYVKGRENPADFNINSKMLARQASKRGVQAYYCSDFNEKCLADKVDLRDFDIIVVLGAGDIYSQAKELIAKGIDLPDDFKDYEEYDAPNKDLGPTMSDQRKKMESDDYYSADKKRKINIK